MARIKRVFVVEGIDNGKIVGSELIKLANRLVEEEGLDVSTTAREKIIGDLLHPGKLARVVAYMSPSDISNFYSQPGGVKKFLEQALHDQADVTEALKLLNGGLANSDGWLQQPALKAGRMTLASLNGPEDRAVILNVPKSVMSYAKPISGKEGVQALLEKILSHNNFIAHLDHKKAKAGLDATATNVDELVNHFNMEAITGYKSREDRANAMVEWKEAKEKRAAAGEQEKTTRSSLNAPAHEFRDWIEEFRLEHKMPKTESGALEFYRAAKAKLAELVPSDKDLQFRVREAGVKMVKPDTGMWQRLVTGDIDGFMDVLKKRADAAGETLPKDEPKQKPKDEPKAAETPTADTGEEPKAAAGQAEVSSGGDLPAPLERLANTMASGIKDNKAWDPKHKGSLVAAIQRALEAK